MEPITGENNFEKLGKGRVDFHLYYVSYMAGCEAEDLIAEQERLREEEHEAHHGGLAKRNRWLVSKMKGVASVLIKLSTKKCI